jgi:exoribonuclease-2
LHFLRKGERWEPRRAEQVAELRFERERVRSRESETAAFFEALRRALREGELRPSGGEFETRYLEALRLLAIHEDDTAPAARELALAALEASGLRHDRPHEGAFRLGRLAGLFPHADANLQVLRYGLRTEFPPEVLEHAAGAARRGFRREGREDLTALETIAIDGASTREVDDALSAEPIEGGVRIGVHIADPGAFVEPDDPVDREAQARGLTHYHPDLRLPMLPPALSEEAASLVEGADRPALSFFADLTDDGEVRASRVVRSVIRVRARTDYDSADRVAGDATNSDAGLLARLVRFGELRERVRLARGAISIRLPEIDLHVAPDGTVEIERIDPSSASRRAVSEAMILAGEIGAGLCLAAGLPAIFRRQVAAELPSAAASAVVSDPVAARRIRRALVRAESSVRPGLHQGLGLAAYVQVTSPLRRFQDLATQRQIASHLAGLPPRYDEARMQRIAATTEQVELEARRAERAAEDYWVLRYLEGAVGGTLEALVVESEPRPVVLLLETMREQPLPSVAGVEVGRRLRLAVQRVNPRAGLLVLRAVEG